VYFYEISHIFPRIVLAWQTKFKFVFNTVNSFHNRRLGAIQVQPIPCDWHN